MNLTIVREPASAVTEAGWPSSLSGRDGAASAWPAGGNASEGLLGCPFICRRCWSGWKIVDTPRPTPRRPIALRSRPCAFPSIAIARCMSSPPTAKTASAFAAWPTVTRRSISVACKRCRRPALCSRQQRQLRRWRASNCSPSTAARRSLSATAIPSSSHAATRS